MEDRKQLGEMLNYILVAAKALRWKSVRRGNGGGGREVAESDSDAGSDVPRYAGTETGDAQVGKLSCVETQWRKMERGTGRERVPPPGVNWVTGKEGMILLRRIAM